LQPTLDSSGLYFETRYVVTAEPSSLFSIRKFVWSKVSVCPAPHFMFSAMSVFPGVKPMSSIRCRKALVGWLHVESVSTRMPMSGIDLSPK
jgi:hypothetical protein